MTPRLFSELGLSEPLLKAIDQLGFEQAAPIQAAAIPLLMQGRDIVGQSQTGSGKTAAFGIPAVEKVDVASRQVQVLVLCPTRELAVQVSEEIHKLALFKRGLHVLPIYGGQSYERQFYGLNRGAHIVIGTPGRIMDHLRRGTLRLEAVRLVVLDEADVMLNMGFREDIETILQSVPKERQTVFFSATIPHPIRDLIDRHARDPQNVRIEQKALTVPTVEQVYYEVDRRFKLELLTRLIDIHDLRLGIIFCNTKRMVDDLADHLEAQGYQADRLHGDMSQPMRDRVMNKFRKSGLEFLVATDVAARGIDVDDVQVVFNYDLPYDGEDYVHRIGRTGRAGRSGRAVSFVSGREVFQIRVIERFTNTRIHRARIPTQAEVEEARENVFLDKLRATLQGGDLRRQEPLVERLLEEGFSSTDIASACLAQLQGLEATSARSASPEPSQRPQNPAPKDRWPDGSRDRDLKRERPTGPARPEQPRPPRSTGTQPTSPLATRSVAPAPMIQPTPLADAEPNQAPKSEPTVQPEPQAGPESKPESTPAPEPVPVQVALPAADGPAADATSRGAASPPSEPSATGPTQPQPPAASGELQPGAADRQPPRVARSQGPPRPRPPRPADAEVPRKSVPPWLQRDFAGTKPARPPGRGRAPVGSFTRLHLNLGEEMGIGPGDVVGAISGETGLPASVVGLIDVRERHLFVDVASEHANAILSKLNRTRLKGQKLKAKVA